MENKTNISHNFTLDSFARSQQQMIATNDNAYNYNNRTSYWDQRRQYRDYTAEEINLIIRSGSILDQQKLSRNYFNKSGYYSQMIIHYGTLLTYAGLLIPNPAYGKNLSTPHIQKRYYSAMDYIERMHLPSFLTNCAIRALVDGCYYGIITELDKDAFTTIDLPAGYCRSLFKDANGNDVIEFNLAFFNTITDLEDRDSALSAYPKSVAKAYKQWSSGKRGPWFIIPTDISICFPMFNGRPPLLSVIPSIIDYDETIISEKEREAEEIRKIVVQKIPHLSDGRLLFEPDEALEIHTGTVGMLKDNKNTSVMTSYADVDIVSSKTQTENSANMVDRMEKNIYSQGGVSSEIFNSTSSGSLASSIKKDISFMMILANKFSIYITNLINRKFSNSNISFKYSILPVSHQNYEKFIDTSFKTASFGYSLLMPAVALGLSQRDLTNIKDLENSVLMLKEKLVPLSSSYTQSTSNNADGAKTSKDENQNKEASANPSGVSIEDGGRPTKEEDEKSDTTIETERTRN